jgi:hypothetical protein
MKKYILALLVSVSLAFTGCTSTPGQADLIAGVASDAAALVLQKNPKAVPTLRAVSAGIDAVLTQNSLTPERVKTFVDLIGKDANLDPDTRFLIGRLVLRTHGALVAKFGTPDLNILDPEVRAALTRVKVALDDTLALYDVLKQ